MKEPIVNAKKNYVEIVVDEKVFPRPVSIAAAYRFIDRCYIKLERTGRGKLSIGLKGKKRLAKSGLVSLAEDLENELLQQLMRSMISEQTAGLREVIVGRALLSAETQEAESSRDEDLDYLDDPLGIAIPWEEKYGDNEMDEDGTTHDKEK